jgi:hypothetical protein
MRSRCSGRKAARKTLPASQIPATMIEFLNELRSGKHHESVLPFTVTKPVTNREMSVALESRDASLVFGKFSEREGCSLQSVSLDGR